MISERTFGPGTWRTDSPSQPGEGRRPRTALPVRLGVPRHLDAHFLRLEAGAAALGHPVAWLGSLREEVLDWVVATLQGGDAALRMVLDVEASRLDARMEPLPVSAMPYGLILMAHPLGERQMDPTLTHKGLAGPWGREILLEARQRGAEDALLLWPDGTLAETAIASVGIEMGRVFKVPPPQGRVSSLAELLDLPAWAEARGLQIEVGGVPQACIGDGQLWCMNALRGIWPAQLL